MKMIVKTIAAASLSMAIVVAPSQAREPEQDMSDFADKLADAADRGGQAEPEDRVGEVAESRGDSVDSRDTRVFDKTRQAGYGKPGRDCVMSC